MTGDQILEFAQTMVDDDFDQTAGFQIMNDVKNTIETEMDLVICHGMDASKSTFAGQTYTTGVVLPTDFLRLTKNVVYVGQVPYKSIPMEKKEIYKNIVGYFWIDIVANKIYFTGTQTKAAVITIPYFIVTPDIAAATSPTWPARFHSLIAYEMAKDYYAIDAGDKARAWDDRWTMKANRLRHALVDWNASLQLQALNGQIGYRDPETEGVPLELM